MADIGSTAEINKIRVKEQAAAPDSPASGYGYLYEKSDGKLYFKNDDGTETDLTVGSDSDAIHDNVSGEIDAIAEKASPVGGDLILIEDSESSNAKKKVQITNLPGGTDGDAIHDNVDGEINAIAEKASPVGGDLLLIEDSAASNAKKKVQISTLPFSSGVDPNHAYYAKLCALLEPDAIEPSQKGTFNYVVGAAETKYLLLGWFLNIGSAGRIDVRNPRDPIPLRDVTLNGSNANSTAAILDPSLPSYADARDTYFDRLNLIAELDTKYLGVGAGASSILFLPGPYGAIVTHITCFDLAWVGLGSPRSSSDVWTIDYEIGDDAADHMRFAHGMALPINKNIVCRLDAYAGEAGGAGSVIYVLLPSTWSAIVDPNSYDFRDDFMGAALDTVSDWTRAQSAAGNIEINPNFAWCKMIGNETWGTNGAYSQTSIARAAGKIFEADICWNSLTPNDGGIVGFSNGAAHDDSDFSHGINFNNGAMSVVEDGTSRGAVGSGITAKCTYRVRITLGASDDATYEIQGGSQYEPLGSASWTDITPGTTSSSTTPLHAGFSVYGATGAVHYIGDVKMY